MTATVYTCTTILCIIMIIFIFAYIPAQNDIYIIFFFICHFPGTWYKGNKVKNCALLGNSFFLFFFVISSLVNFYCIFHQPPDCSSMQSIWSWSSNSSASGVCPSSIRSPSNRKRREEIWTPLRCAYVLKTFDILVVFLILKKSFLAGLSIVVESMMKRKKATNAWNKGENILMRKKSVAFVFIGIGKH